MLLKLDIYLIIGGSGCLDECLEYVDCDLIPGEGKIVTNEG